MYLTNEAFSECLEKAESPSRVSAPDGEIQAFTEKGKRFVRWDSVLPGSEALPDEHERRMYLSHWKFLLKLHFGYELPENKSFSATLIDLLAPFCAEFKNWSLARLAYIGGRSEIYRWKGKGDLYHYDLPGAYGVAGCEAMPTGLPFRSKKDSEPGCLSLYRIVGVQGGWIPPLPTKTETGTAYAQGKIAGLFWRHEAELLKNPIIEQVWHVPASPVLKPYFEKWLAVKEEHRIFAKVAKQAIVRSVGLLGTKPSRKVYSRKKPTSGLFRYVGNGLWESQVTGKEFPFVRVQVPCLINSLIRAKVYQALKDVPQKWLVSVSTDGYISSEIVSLPDFRMKWKKAGIWFAPWPSCLVVNGHAHTSPGVKKGECFFYEQPRFTNRVALPNGDTIPVQR